jgi:hypothetical protein
MSDTAKASPDKLPTAKTSDGWFIAHDLVVWVGAIVLLLGGWLAYSSATAPKMKRFDRHGLTFSYPSGWLGEDADPQGFPSKVTFTDLKDASQRVEVRITEKPLLDGPIGIVLENDRVQKYRGMYKRMDSGERQVNGKTWSRAEFVYAFKATEDDAPQVVNAVEYGLVNNDKLYVVSVHGPKGRVGTLERDVLGTLSLK